MIYPILISMFYTHCHLFETNSANRRFATRKPLKQTAFKTDRSQRPTNNSERKLKKQMGVQSSTWWHRPAHNESPHRGGRRRRPPLCSEGRPKAMGWPMPSSVLSAFGPQMFFGFCPDLFSGLWVLFVLGPTGANKCIFSASL